MTSEPSISSSMSHVPGGLTSTVEFAMDRAMGNLGEPLEHPYSTWVSVACDDVDEKKDDERFCRRFMVSMLYADGLFFREDSRELETKDEVDAFGATTEEMLVEDAVAHLNVV